MTRPTAFAVLLCLATLSGAGHAATIFDLYADGTSLQKLTVMAGAEVNLEVRINTDDPVVGVGYDVVMPGTGWSLTGRDYGTHGWSVGGIFDNSSPLATDTYPVDITDDLWQASGSAIDFRFDSGRADFTALTAGDHITEKFSLKLPTGLTEGTYWISLASLGAFDLGGSPLSTSGGPDFELEVNVPEPGTVSLVLLGLGALAYVGRRRRKED